MFSREGFKWDVGVHAIGNVQRGVTAWMFNTACAKNKKIEWLSLGDPFDTTYWPKGV